MHNKADRVESKASGGAKHDLSYKKGFIGGCMTTCFLRGISVKISPAFVQSKKTDKIFKRDFAWKRVNIICVFVLINTEQLGDNK